MHAPVPPAPVATPAQAHQWLSVFPAISKAGQVYRVLSVRAKGERTLLDAAAAKLATEGWPTNVAPDHTGTVYLDISPKSKQLDDVSRLMQRFAAGEFGAIQAGPLTLPDPIGL